MGLFYLAITLPLGYLVNVLEQRLGRSTAATGRSGVQTQPAASGPRGDGPAPWRRWAKP